jgi:hypothetical protein
MTSLRRETAAAAKKQSYVDSPKEILAAHVSLIRDRCGHLAKMNMK